MSTFNFETTKSMITKSLECALSGRNIVLVLLSVPLLLGLTSCAINPATGQGNLVLMSEKREIEIGTEEHAKVITSTAMYSDEELLAYVRQVGQRVAAVSHRPDLEYHFNVVDSPEINAFALPGGYVYVNRGLLSYMNSEAELAAVLAHEIGHITARHAVQQQARGKLARSAAGIGGIVTAVATGSGYIGSEISQIASIWAQSGLSGFGREHELEADSLGAEYLVAAGYDPNAVIEVVSVLKNQEDFNKLVNNGQGSYHGLFATHPRNDKRLQEAVAAVGELSTDQVTLIDDTEFRQHIDGLIVGENRSGSITEVRNRYYQTLLGYTVVFPDDWQISETPTTVTASMPELGSINISAQRLHNNLDPRDYIKDNLGIQNLQKSEPLNQYRLLGHTGVVTKPEGGLERVAVIYYGPRVFAFRADIEPENADEIDDLLLGSIRTFRAIQRNEANPGSEPRIKYVQASEYFQFSEIAKTSKIASYPEETLRLLNGYYPRGTPEKGDWVKLVQ